MKNYTIPATGFKIIGDKLHFTSTRERVTNVPGIADITPLQCIQVLKALVTPETLKPGTIVSRKAVPVSTYYDPYGPYKTTKPKPQEQFVVVAKLEAEAMMSKMATRALKDGECVIISFQTGEAHNATVSELNVISTPTV